MFGLTSPSPQPTAQPQEKLGFWGKTKLAVKEFFSNAVKALPMSIIFTGLSFGASALMGQYLGFNPLHVEGFTKELVGRMIGSVVIGSSISGVVGSVRAVMDADNPAPPATAPQARGQGPERDREQAMDFGLSPGRTPAVARPPVQRPGARPGVVM